MSIQSLSSLEKSWRELQQQKQFSRLVHYKNSPDISHVYNLSGNYPNNYKPYIPVPTGRLFHDDETEIRLIMGPYGSGKTTCVVQEIIKRACSMPAWYYGRRKSKWLIIRNTSGELQTTTLQTWLSWAGDLGDISDRQKPVLNYNHTFNDGFGIVDIDLLFLPLDKLKDIGKLKSFEITGAFINELSEIPRAVLDHLKGRIGRFPSAQDCPEYYWRGIIADTNPPDEDSWIKNDFDDHPTKSYKIFKQPPGLIKSPDGRWVRNVHCDNFSNLSSPAYYELLAENASEEFIKVFCLGKYGMVGLGKLVYTDYNDDLHSVEHIKPIDGLPINLGFDFGLTPACTVSQMTPRGQFMLLKEYVTEGMGIRSFAKNIVIPGLARDFPNHKIGFSVADPSGNKRNEIMEEMSCIKELNDVGIETRPARTNNIEPRLASVRFFLTTMIDGKPGFQLSRSGCPVTRKGFVKNYVYKRLAVPGEERYREEPDKNGASHPHDSLQYQCLELAANYISLDKFKKDVVKINNKSLSVL